MLSNSAERGEIVAECLRKVALICTELQSVKGVSKIGIVEVEGSEIPHLINLLGERAAVYHMTTGQDIGVRLIKRRCIKERTGDLGGEHGDILGSLVTQIKLHSYTSTIF